MDVNFYRKKNLIQSLSVILSDPPCKVGNAPFTMVPFKALSDHLYELDIQIRHTNFILFTHFFAICGFSAKLTCAMGMPCKK